MIMKMIMKITSTRWYHSLKKFCQKLRYFEKEKGERNMKMTKIKIMNMTSTTRDQSLKDILPVIKIFWKKKEGEIRQEMTKNKIMNMISTRRDDNEYNMIMIMMLIMNITSTRWDDARVWCVEGREGGVEGRHQWISCQKLE